MAQQPADNSGVVVVIYNKPNRGSADRALAFLFPSQSGVLGFI
jgi:hypothetical protein